MEDDFGKDYNNSYYNSYYDSSKKPEPIKKNVHIHTIICVCMIAAALVLSGGTLAAAYIYNANSVKSAYEINFSEIEEDNMIEMYSNNQLILEDVAYTLVKADTVQHFPEGDKLIALFCQIKSEIYIDGNNPIKDIYLGYEGGYKKPLSYELISSQLEPLGFTVQQALSLYAGNGNDTSGFLFFLVPEDINEITVFLEERSKKQRVPQITKRYFKTNVIIEPSVEDVKQLLNKGVPE